MEVQWYVPLKRLVTLTTVLRYRAACDMDGCIKSGHLLHYMLKSTQ